MHFQPQNKMELSGQCYALVTLPQWKEPQYPLDRRLGRGLAVLDGLEKRQVPYPYHESNF